MCRIRCLLAAVLLLLSFQASYANFDEFTAQESLQRQIEIIENLEYFVERSDLGRLIFLKKTTLKTLGTLKENGLGHMRTFRSFQELVVSYRYSYSFFKQISMQATTQDIEEIRNINEIVAKGWGFDESLYTQITASILQQKLAKHKPTISEQSLTLID